LPVKALSCGALVFVDAEDWECTETRSWHVYELRPSRRPAVAASEQRHGRMYRVTLHREIALRRDPTLIKKRFRVYPENGSYLDCRRDNLRVVVQKKRCGQYPIEARPQGWERMRVTGKRARSTKPGSISWAGGYTYVQKWGPSGKPGNGRIRKCIGNRPVD
jgi:hypothetical protein